MHLTCYIILVSSVFYNADIIKKWLDVGCCLLSGDNMKHFNYCK
jgi:hypothetical protein